MEKQIIKFKDVIGSEIRTRLTIESFSITLQGGVQYLFDMEGVESISRSAADELFNLIESHQHIILVNMSDFVKNMFDIVAIGRFKPRQLKIDSIPVTYCSDLKSLSQCLNAH